jgi:hypothetical protein
MATPTPQQFLQWYQNGATVPRPHATMAQWLLERGTWDSEAAFEQYLEEVDHGTQDTPFVLGPAIAHEMLIAWRNFKGKAIVV